MKNKNSKINKTLSEKSRDVLENPNFEQNKNSITSNGIYKIAHDSVRIMKWICSYDRSYYEIFTYFDLLGSVCEYLNEISKR